MGQFLDHDMTFDSTSRLGVPERPELSPNLRDPAFETGLGVWWRTDCRREALRPSEKWTVCRKV
jgi:hypothetical protein